MKTFQCTVSLFIVVVCVNSDFGGEMAQMIEERCKDDIFDNHVFKKTFLYFILYLFTVHMWPPNKQAKSIYSHIILSMHSFIYYFT